MKNIKLLSLALLLCLLASCSSADDKGAKKQINIPNAALESESDSLAYVIGVSMAKNILAVDSLIDLEVVATAIAQYGKGESPFDAEEARTTFLKYKFHIIPERRRGYEESYLKELAAANRDLTRTKSGITYNIKELGNVSNTPRSSNDWIEIDYTISRVDSTEIFSTYTNKESYSGALSSLPEGVMECLRLVGKGGKVSAYIPSVLAYGDEGDEELGVEPYETLRYDIELSGFIKNGARNQNKSVKPSEF